MRLPNLLVILGTLSACAPDQNDRREIMMDEIERALILPPGALNLNDYARYYTEDRGLIHGAFTTEIETRSPDVGCSELSNDSKMVDVSCSAVADLTPGSRRWVPYNDYPAVADKNCRAVQIAYNPRSKVFEYNECASPTD